VADPRVPAPLTNGDRTRSSRGTRSDGEDPQWRGDGSGSSSSSSVVGGGADLDGRGDRGSVLLLMPAGVLVVLVLGALAVDLSIVHLGEREVSAAANAAANDAATWALDQAALYTTGDLALDPDRATHAVHTSLHAQEYSGRHAHLVGAPRLTDRSGNGHADTITVTVAMEVDYLFARVMPGAPRGTTVSATATATATARTD
jgi:hypothetical protein